MVFSVHYYDKACPGLHHSVSVDSDVKPAIKAKVGPTALPVLIERLDTIRWKGRFLLPKEAKGELEVEVTAGSNKSADKKAIG